MNEIINTVTKRLAVGCLVVSAAGLCAFAQDARPAQFRDTRSAATGGAGVVVPARPGRIDAAKIQMNKRAAIAFKPFDRSLDPRTGKALAPNARITLPNGKTAAATQYFDALDAVEKKLNAQGYSLRGPEKVITLTRLVTPTQLLDKQAQAILSVHKPTAGGLAPNPPGKQVLEKLQPVALQDFNKVKPVLAKVGPAIPPTTVDKSYPWSYPFGDPATFYASFSGHVELKGTAGNYGAINKVGGEIIANGSIFNVGEEMLRGTGSITSHPNGATDLSLKINVAGNTIYNKTTSVSLPQWHEDAWKDFDWSASVPVDLDFGISLDATIGVKGTANGEFAFFATPTALTTNTHGYAQGHVYASAALKLDPLGIDIAEAGVKADMLLIFLVMDEQGGIGLKLDPNNQLCLDGHMHVQDDVTVLKGNVTAYVRLLGKEIDQVLWDNPGFHYAGSLLDLQLNKRLN